MIPHSQIDHVGIAVPSLEAAAPLYASLEGVPLPQPIEILPDQGVRVLFLGAVELLEPLHPDTPVGRFLSARGGGIHHVAWRVPDLPSAIARLTAEGYRMIDAEPRPGARGHRVAFLHPSSTGRTLVELVEASPPSP